MAKPPYRPRKSRRKHERSYGGPEYSPPSALQSQANAREFFLDLVARMWPAILTELHDDAFEPCLRLLDGAIGLPAEWVDALASDVEHDLPPAGAVVRALVRALALRGNLG